MAPRPSGPHLAQRLRNLALTSPTATSVFYARLYRALFPPTELDHDSLHVLALCYLSAGQAYPALHVVREYADADADPDLDIPDYENGIPARSPGCYGCAVIVAKCCNSLHRYTEGQAVLDRAIRRSVPMTLPTPCPAETSAAASLLLASLSHKSKAPAQAVDYYTRALADDPWLWEAFTGLCDVGAAPAPDTVFVDPPSMTRSTSQRTSRTATLSPGPMPRSSASEVPNFLSRRQLSPLSSSVPSTSLFTPDAGGAAAPSRLGMMGNAGSWDTPSTVADTTFPTIGEQSGNGTRRPLPNLLSSFIPTLPAALRSTPNPGLDVPSAKPPAMKRPRPANSIRKPAETPVGGPLATEARINARDLMPELSGDKMIEPPVRRSSRLTTGKPSTRTTREKRSTRSQSVASSGSGHAENAAAALEAQTQAAVDDWLRDVVRRCGRAYRALSLYQCQEALAELDGLPGDVQTTPWAYALAARCFYEMADYVKGRRAFEKLVAAEPYGLEAMAQYSTLLWHLGDASALSHLSQVLLSVNREAAEPWIASGNLFSVRGDHDEAMRCFRRATHLDPGNAYAWTLCGHEAMSMEENERAIAFYRTAIRADSRHYQAWFGMGRVYHNMGKMRHAEHHFRRATEINPSSSVLLCCLGLVIEEGGDLPGALAVYDRACALPHDSDGSMTQFKRVRVLVALGRVQEAITALERLAKLSADEANVHMLLGKCYLRVGRNTQAMVAFTAARELHPKLEGAIRATLLAHGEDVEGEGE